MHKKIIGLPDLNVAFFNINIQDASVTLTFETGDEVLSCDTPSWYAKHLANIIQKSIHAVQS